MPSQALAAHAAFFLAGDANRAFARAYRALRPSVVRSARLLAIGALPFGLARAYEKGAWTCQHGPVHSLAGLMTSLMPPWVEDIWRLILIPFITISVIEGLSPTQTKSRAKSWHEVFSAWGTLWTWVWAEILYFPAGIIHELGHYLAGSFFFEASDGVFLMDRGWAQGELRYDPNVIRLWLDQIGVSRAGADIGVRLSGFFLPVLYGYVLFYLGRRAKSARVRNVLLMASSWTAARVMINAIDMLLAVYSFSGAMNDFPAVAMLSGAHARWVMPVVYAAAFGLPAWVIYRVAQIRQKIRPADTAHAELKHAA